MGARSAPGKFWDLALYIGRAKRARKKMGFWPRFSQNNKTPKFKIVLKTQNNKTPNPRFVQKLKIIRPPDPIWASLGSPQAEKFWDFQRQNEIFIRENSSLWLAAGGKFWGFCAQKHHFLHGLSA